MDAGGGLARHRPRSDLRRLVGLRPRAGVRAHAGDAVAADRPTPGRGGAVDRDAGGSSAVGLGPDGPKLGLDAGSASLEGGHAVLDKVWAGRIGRDPSTR